MTRIYIHGADNNVLYTGPDDRGRAGGRATNRGAGLQSNVKRGASRHVVGEVAKAFDLSVVMACSSTLASFHNPSINHKNRPASRIGSRVTLCLFSFFPR